MAYRFDFSSSSTDPEKHLAVCTGLFEEYEVKELEVVHDETGTGRDRVISSFVKMIRVEEAQGKMRLSKLIEELIELENSQNPTWDSDIGKAHLLNCLFIFSSTHCIVNHYLQKYNREYFKRILKAEILCEARRNMQEAINEAKSKGKLNGRLAIDNGGMSPYGDDMSLDSTISISKADASKKRFLHHKQLLQQAGILSHSPFAHSHIYLLAYLVVDRGLSLIRKRVEVFDDNSQQWRHVFVINANVKWVENGMKAFVTHIVQEYDELYENVGSGYLLILFTYPLSDSVTLSTSQLIYNSITNSLIYLYRIRN